MSSLRSARIALALLTLVISVLVVAQWLPGAAASPGGPTRSDAPAVYRGAAEAPGEPIELAYEIVAEYPHDPGAFTQGLLLSGDTLYEGTGLFGQSTLREVDLETGVVLRQVELAADLFGEGIARFDERIIQLTWRNGIAVVWDAVSFAESDRWSYEGEGWGLCYDGARLFMSNGSDRISVRDSESFVELEGFVVMDGVLPVSSLNELECVGGDLYANVYPSSRVVRIDPTTGRVTGNLDLAGLRGGDDMSSAGVTNGIAFDERSGHFLVTGKNWLRLFEIRLVEG